MSKDYRYKRNFPVCKCKHCGQLLTSIQAAWRHVKKTGHYHCLSFPTEEAINETRTKRGTRKQSNTQKDRIH